MSQDSVEHGCDKRPWSSGHGIINQHPLPPCRRVRIKPCGGLSVREHTEPFFFFHPPVFPPCTLGWRLLETLVKNIGEADQPPSTSAPGSLASTMHRHLSFSPGCSPTKMDEKCRYLPLAAHSKARPQCVENNLLYYYYYLHNRKAAVGFFFFILCMTDLFCCQPLRFRCDFQGLETFPFVFPGSAHQSLNNGVAFQQRLHYHYPGLSQRGKALPFCTEQVTRY